MILYRLIDLYSLVVLAAVILSWIPSAQDHPAARFVATLTEPALKKIRAVLPEMGGFDLSPMLLLLALQFLQRLIR